MPDVSVVIPTWNRAGTIVESITSVLGDEGVSIEVVVVDDGSTDDTRLRVSALGDERVRVLPRPHEGIAASRNAGVLAASADLIAFHDSDDLALPGRLARAVSALRDEPHLGFVVQNGRMLSESGASGSGRPWIPRETARRLAGAPLGVREVFEWNLGQLQGMCFRRTALEAAGPFDGRFRILDDLDLVLRVAARSPGRFLDVEAFAYHTHAGGVSRDRAAVRREAIAVADALAARDPAAVAAIGCARFRRRQGERWIRLAREAGRGGDASERRRALREAWRLGAGSLATRLRVLRAWAGW